MAPQLVHDPAVDRFVAVCAFNERLIPKEAGFRWDPANKQWFTIDPEKAERLVKYADSQTADMVRSKADSIRGVLDESAALSSDIDIPCNPGMSYLGYQRAGIYYASQRPNTLIGDEMGLGKTIQALGLINYDESVTKVLVICPASLRINWKRESEKWLVREMTVGIADTKNGLPETDVVIINYDIVWKKGMVEKVNVVPWDLIICDECHNCKNPKAKRTKATLAIPAKRRLFLTGTPILNRPIELWPIINTADPATWKSFWYFAKRYCNAHRDRYGWDMTGASNLDELQKKLRLSIMVRRLKKDVLTELPAKIRQVVEVPPNGSARVLNAEKKAWGDKLDRIERLRALRDQAELDANDEAFKAAVEELSAEMQVAFTEMAELRHQTALAKVPAASQFILDSLESSAKIVVFAHHRDVIAQLAEAIREKEIQAVTLTGGTPMEARQQAVDDFQEKGSVRVFLGNIKAAGVGLTLTAASHVIFVEEDWTPGNITQAEDRCHRIGQTDSVLVQHLVLDGSLDATMAKTLVAKQAIIEKALDNPDALKEDDFDLSALEALIPKEKPRQQAHVPAEQIEAIHQNLRFLSFRCDGASTEDGMGYNKFDAAFGKKMAAMEKLTPNQAFAARQMLVKYRRQLGDSAVDAMFGSKKGGGK